MRAGFRLVLRLAADYDQGRAAEGGQPQVLTADVFLRPEAAKVLRDHGAQDVVFRVVGLDQGRPRDLASPGAADHLGEQAERVLSRSEIRQGNRGIRGNDADQSHAGNVMSFPQHLRSNQDLRFSVLQGFQNGLDLPPVLGGVAVEAGDPGCGETPLDLGFHLLGARPEIRELSALTERAEIRGPAAEGTEVATQTLDSLMVSQFRRTVWAFEFVSAIIAEQNRMVSTAIQEKESLLPLGKCLAQGGGELRGEHAVFRLALAEIDDPDRRQGTLGDPLGQ